MYQFKKTFLPFFLSLVFFTIIFPFDTFANDYAQPTLISPTDGATVANSTVFLDWDSITFSYSVAVFDSVGDVVHSVFVSGTSQNTTPSLPNGDYKWEVDPCHDPDCSSISGQVSDRKSFTVAAPFHDFELLDGILLTPISTLNFIGTPNDGVGTLFDDQVFAIKNTGLSIGSGKITITGSGASHFSCLFVQGTGNSCDDFSVQGQLSEAAQIRFDPTTTQDNITAILTVECPTCASENQTLTLKGDGLAGGSSLPDITFINVDPTTITDTDSIDFDASVTDDNLISVDFEVHSGTLSDPIVATIGCVYSPPAVNITTCFNKDIGTLPAGTYTYEVIATDADGLTDTDSASFTVTGGGGFTVSPSISFGSQSVGVPATLNFDITNNEPGPITVVIAETSDPDDAYLHSPITRNIALGGVEAVAVTYTPPAAGFHTADFEFTSVGLTVIRSADGSVSGSSDPVLVDLSHIPISPVAGGAVDYSAVFSDPDGIDFIRIRIDVDGDGNIDAIQPCSFSGNNTIETCSVNHGGYADGTFVRYDAIADDAIGNSTSAPFQNSFTVGGDGDDGDGDGDGDTPVTIKFLNPLGEDATLEGVIENIAKFLLRIAVIIAPILLVVAGVIFMTAAGDPGRISSARRMLIWTIIGFTVILLSRGLIAVLKSILGTS